MYMRLLQNCLFKKKTFHFLGPGTLAPKIHQLKYYFYHTCPRRPEPKGCVRCLPHRRPALFSVAFSIWGFSPLPYTLVFLPRREAVAEGEV
jgi:hypothetical protein